MKLKDFLSVVDLKKLDAEDLDYLRRHLLRIPDRMSPAAMWAMYGDEEGHLEAEQKRADLARTRAQVAKLQAEADKARAEADSQRAGTSRSS